TWQSLYDDPDLQRRHPLLAVQRQSLELGALVRPLTPLYAQYSDVLQRQVNGVLSGSRSVELAMAEAQRQSTRVAEAVDPR
ncbi:MAG: ABC transporter substrate-binding protein, partial [Cyanobacteriota bacterium]